VDLEGLGHWTPWHHWSGHWPSPWHWHGHLGHLLGPWHVGPWHGGPVLLPVDDGGHHSGGLVHPLPLLHLPEWRGDGEHVVGPGELELAPLGVLWQRADLLVHPGGPPGGPWSAWLRDGGVDPLDEHVAVLDDDVNLGPVDWWKSDVDGDLLLVGGEDGQELLHAEHGERVLDWHLDDEQAAPDEAHELLSLDVWWHVEALLDLLEPDVLLVLLDLLLAPDEQLVVWLKLNLDVLEWHDPAADVDDDAPLLEHLLQRVDWHRWGGGEPLGLVEPLDPRWHGGLEHGEVELIERVPPERRHWHSDWGGRAEEGRAWQEGEWNSRHFQY